MKVRQYKDILLECLVTLRHARTFVTSREKMHQTGIELYDNMIVEVKEALDAPEPSLPVSETCNCDRSSAWKCMNSTNDLVCGCKCHGGVYGTSPSEEATP